MNTADKIKIITKQLKESDLMVALTGAGISAESGIPTFRGKDGYWREYKPQDLATPQAFARDPELVWEFYDYRRKLVSQVEPNIGHLSLANIQEQVNDSCIITQNVDNLHYRAGSKNIIELHGNLAVARCISCDYQTHELETPLNEIPPKCPRCAKLLRPGVVWFGEQLPQNALNDAFTYSQQCDIMLVIGTSGVVQPAASLPMIARKNNAFIVEINIEQTPISSIADLTIYEKSGKVLEQIEELLTN